MRNLLVFLALSTSLAASAAPYRCTCTYKVHCARGKTGSVCKRSRNRMARAKTEELAEKRACERAKKACRDRRCQMTSSSCWDLGN